MKKTTLLMVVLCTGFFVQPPAWSQTNASLPASGLTAEMISNVLRLSTTPETVAEKTNAAATNNVAPPTSAGSAPVTIAPAATAADETPSTNSAGANPLPTASVETAPTGPETAGGALTNAPSVPAAGPVSGQEPAAAVEGNVTAQPVSTNLETPVNAVTHPSAGPVGTNQPGALSVSNETAAAGVTNLPAGVATNAVAAEASTNAPAEPEIPISFQDVPIRTAIESLARLAGINYLLDPAIGYGQPGPNGQIKPEPILTVHWERVTAREALLAVLDNYGLELVPNPKTHIARITVKPPNALPPLVTRVIQLKYASASNMLGAVNGVLTDRRSRVIADERTSQLVVSATDSEQAEIDTLITNLDKPTRQVLIETKLVELSSNPSTSKGIDWSGTLGAQAITFGNGVLSQSSSSTVNSQTPGSSTVPLPGGGSTTGGSSSQTINSTTTTTTESGNGIANWAVDTAHGLNPATAFLSADGLKAVLSFLNQTKEAQVVSTPRIVTLDNQTASIAVTRGFPVINVTASTAGVSSGSSQITYSNIGTVLYVTPRITANDYIWLKVVPDVSSFFGTDSKTIAGQTYQADIFDSRHIETQVLIPNAHTLVMGGLVQDNPTVQYTKVPILGDIPVLGLAFRSENKTMNKDNLLIFLTPTILKDSDFQTASTDFLQSQPRTMKEPMNPHSWWDSAEPRGDWSNPLEPPDQQPKSTVMP
ncbi:MAG TPA: secretin N-terminal domain-containing protein [Verrucomicrobiae bacterium]|nr:secretin N-terminal domain-containing protein [Verrucomicrobiae bacterium]